MRVQDSSIWMEIVRHYIETAGQYVRHDFEIWTAPRLSDSVFVCFLCFFRIAGQVDFIELVERLNVLRFGSKVRKLSALFSVYDLDNSGKISRAELEQVVKALGHSDSELVEIKAKNLFKAVDQNHDGLISKEGQMTPRTLNQKENRHPPTHTHTIA